MYMAGRRISIILNLAAITIGAACGPNQRILDSAKPAASRSPAANVTPVSELERDLETMGTADFNFIHVFRRKDGAEFDAEDKKFLNANTPAEINRRVLSDGGRALITGSNFRFPPENFKNLTERFAFEDFSKSKLETTEKNQIPAQ